MFYKKAICFMLIASGILGVAEVSAAVSVESFACSRAIELDSNADKLKQSALVTVPLANDMYRWLNPELSDVRVFDDQGKPVASKVISRSSQKIKEYPLPDEAITIEFDKKKHWTLITFDIKKLPVSKIQLHTKDRNFQRDVEVVVPSVGFALERVVESDSIQRIDVQGLEKERLSVGFWVVREPQLQLRIYHGENPPIKIEKVQLFGPIYECRFIAEPGRHYTLAYGSKSIGSGDLDSAALDAAQRRDLQPVKATLSEEVTQREPVEPDDDLEYSLNAMLENPWMVYPVVILLVAALGYGLIRAARRMPSVDSQDEGDGEKITKEENN